jgi:hypothetical protein
MAYFGLNEWQNVQICYHPTVKDTPEYTAPGFTRCPVSDIFPLLPGEAKEGIVSWGYLPAPKEQRALIDAAGHDVWNIEVAVYNDANQWDSKFGANYKFAL